jgi:hypothetical protein
MTIAYPFARAKTRLRGFCIFRRWLSLASVHAASFSPHISPVEHFGGLRWDVSAAR